MSDTTEYGLEFLDEGQQSEEAPDSDLLNQAELNLRKAQCYREMISAVFFEDQDEITEAVSREMRAFAQQRYAQLLGVVRSAQAGQVAATQFTPEQAKVLAALANGISANPAILAKVMGTPQQKRAVRVRPQEPTGPRVVRRAAPSPAMPTKQYQQPQEQPASAPAPAPKPSKPAIPAHESVEHKDGRVYKIHWVQIAGKEEIPPGMEGFEQGGSWFKLVRSDITPAPKSYGIPMPAPSAVAALSMMKSAESFDLQGRSARNLAARLGAT